jgi:hypothetical protein
MMMKDHNNNANGHDPRMTRILIKVGSSSSTPSLCDGSKNKPGSGAVHSMHEFKKNMAK